MILPRRYHDELMCFNRFVTHSLTSAEEQILRLLAVDGLLQKQIARKIGRSEKTVERLVSSIVHKYHEFYVTEPNVSNRRILNRAACYYYLSSLISKTSPMLAPD